MFPSLLEGKEKLPKGSGRIDRWLQIMLVAFRVSTQPDARIGTLQRPLEAPLQPLTPYDAICMILTKLPFGSNIVWFE